MKTQQCNASSDGAISLKVICLVIGQFSLDLNSYWLIQNVQTARQTQKPDMAENTSDRATSVAKKCWNDLY